MAPTSMKLRRPARQHRGIVGFEKIHHDPVLADETAERRLTIVSYGARDELDGSAETDAALSLTARTAATP